MTSNEISFHHLTQSKHVHIPSYNIFTFFDRLQTQIHQNDSQFNVEKQISQRERVHNIATSRTLPVELGKIPRTYSHFLNNMAAG